MGGVAFNCCWVAGGCSYINGTENPCLLLYGMYLDI